MPLFRLLKRAHVTVPVLAKRIKAAHPLHGLIRHPGSVAFLASVISIVLVANQCADLESNTEEVTNKKLPDKEVASLLHWLQSSHGVSLEENNLSIVSTQYKGASVVAKKDSPSLLSNGTSTVATIPRRATVNMDTLQADDGPAPDYFRTWLKESLHNKQLTERRILILYYLCEGRKSPYLLTFPLLSNNKTPTPPLFWSQPEKQLLQNTELEKPLRAKERALSKEWALIVKPLLKDLGILGTNYRDFCWADSLFWTRVLEYSTPQSSVTYHWVPLVDACNHSYSPNVSWEADEHGNVALTCIPNDDDNHNTQELCYMYGEKSNAELLFSHGFCIPGNPFDSVSWPLKDLSDAQKELLATIQLAPRITAHRELQQYDFGEEVLGHFDLESIYMLFLLVLEPTEVHCHKGNKFTCQIDGSEDKMEIESYDDFEDFIDQQCDALMPRVRLLVEQLIMERQRQHGKINRVPSKPSTFRERQVHLLLDGQNKLLADVLLLLRTTLPTEDQITQNSSKEDDKPS